MAVGYKLMQQLSFIVMPVGCSPFCSGKQAQIQIQYSWKSLLQHHGVVEVICSNPPLEQGDLEQIAPDHLLNDLSSQDPTGQDLLLRSF